MIKNGKVVNVDRSVAADVRIKDGKVVRIGKNLSPGRAEVIDARGMLLLPGGIDSHVHFNLPSCGTLSEDWDTGTAAAACGGVTTVIDFAIPAQDGTLREAVENRMADARDKVAVDFSLHGGITAWNERTREEMRHYTQNGIPSFKMFMIYRKQGWMADDRILFSALEETRKHGALVMLHCESALVLDLLIARYHDGGRYKRYGACGHALSRPCYTEYEAVQRAATWAKITGGRIYLVHLSTSEGADIVAQARREGVSIWAETCPQYLLLTDRVFRGSRGHYFATCPQIKKKHDAVGLLKEIKNGTIPVLATDTCGFSSRQKDRWDGDFTKIPYGLPGVETLVPTMYTLLVGKNRMPLGKFVGLVSTNPAKLFGLYPKKGCICVGSDADLVVFDPNQRVTLDHKHLATRCDWSPFQGMKITGYPKVTISRGRVVAREGKFTGSPGWGRFVERKPGGVI